MKIPSQEVITKDNSPTNVDAIVYIRIIDPEKAYFEVAHYRMATVALAQTSLRGIIGDMELDEVLYNRERINTKLRDILDRETDQWGVKVECVEIKEVDPVEAVKNAMTEQTMANGQATKIIFPFEISQLIKQGAKFLGATDESLEEPSKIVLDETILGNIPKREEVETLLKEMQEAIPRVSEEELKDPARRKAMEALASEKDLPHPMEE